MHASKTFNSSDAWIVLVVFLFMIIYWVMSINYIFIWLMTEVLFLYIMPVYESRRSDYWSLITIDWCIQYIWLLYHFLFEMSVNKIWIFKLCEWLIESKVGVSFFDSSFGRQSTVCIPKFWYNLPIIYFYSVFVAEYKYPNVSVWFYSDQYALNVIRLFVHVDQLKWVMPLFEHVYTVEIIFI